MKLKKWEWEWFGEERSRERIIIDSRLERGAEYHYRLDERKLVLVKDPKLNWTPLLEMKYSERFTVEEFEQYAQVITDRLNAFETENALKGSE